MRKTIKTKPLKAWATIWKINIPDFVKVGDIARVDLHDMPISSQDKIWEVVPCEITLTK